MSKNTELVSCRLLSKEYSVKNSAFSSKGETVKAVDEVSLSIKRGETLGLVGESGCGKSTLGRLLIRLLDPTVGTITFDGQDISKIKGKELRQLRRRFQIIFQDPYSCLNPRMKVWQILSEPIKIHKICSSQAETIKKVNELIELVGLPSDSAQKYPHQFSGGQRQRIAIARALAVEPEFIVCDEPVSALDVSIQAQILNLMMDLQQKLGLTYLFIAHDLHVVEHISTNVAIMYLGKIVEHGPAEEIYKNPKHPYTQALLSATPIPIPNHKKERVILKGDLPSPIHRPSGCNFHTRCPKADEQCTIEIPSLEQPENSERTFSCWHPV